MEEGGGKAAVLPVCLSVAEFNRDLAKIFYKQHNYVVDG